MSLLRSSLAWATVTGLAIALFAAPAAAQDRGVITGTITDASTGAPLIGVQVVVEGTTIGGLTAANGRFRIQSVPTGTRTVRAILIGYGPVTEVVSIVAGETVVVDLALATSAIALDEVVVTAVGNQRKRELGNAVGTIDAASITETAPVNSITDLLTGRTAGVQVAASSGQAGMGSRIRIRGSSSISLSNEPLLYVDGIRVESASPSVRFYTGGQEPSRLNDFNPEDIESIEIIKGPAAATLYGTEAANGVIRITTKQGRGGETRWNAWIETGLVQEKTLYPDNYAGLDASGGSFAESCLLQDELDGLCTQTGIAQYQVLNDPDPMFNPRLDDGNRQQYGLSVSGGSERINYYLSAELEDETGPYTLPGRDRAFLEGVGIPISSTTERPEQLERVSVRANLNGQVAENATVQLRAGYLTSNHSFLANDNNSFGFLPSAFFGGAFQGRSDSWGFQDPAQLFARDVYQNIERFTGSLGANWTPLEWLAGRANVGLDYTSRNDVSFHHRDVGVPGQTNLGRKDNSYFNIFQYTVDFGGTATFDIADNITSKTSAGVQYFRNIISGTDAWGIDIVNGAKSIGASAENFSDEFTTEDKTLGTFIEQQFGINDRLFLTGAVRADDNSAFGRDFDAVIYPKLAVSWLLSEEDFFPEIGFLDQFRIRSAWGKSGLQPGSDDAIRTLAAEAITDPSDNTISGVSIGEVGNTLLEPEKSSEIEIGFDADMFGGRMGLEVTYYNKSTTDALVNAPLAPSLGASTSRWVNIGEVKNQGWEAAINASLMNTETVSWDATLSGSVNTNELIDLGDNPPIGSQTRFIEGFPLGGQWGRPINSFTDTNGNGIIESGELSVGDTLEYIAPGLPTQEVSFTSSITLFERVRIYGLIDYKGDYVSYNNTERFRCRFALCEPLVDRNATLENQARAVAAVYHPSQTNAGYIEDASFFKLREVSATIFMPEEWAGAMKASRASFTVTGRNLKTWTDYTGVDPEINSAGAGDNFGTGEFLTQAPLRYWTLRFNFNF